MRVSIHEIMGKEVNSRAAVRALLAIVAQNRDLNTRNKLTLDFSGVTFVTRSAMHELLTAKVLETASTKQPVFQNMAAEVEEMYEVVSKTKYASAPPIKNFEVIEVKSLEDIPEFES